MLGDFLTRCLVLFLGYAYPAFECFKVVEKNKVEIEQLRFWCQYWIIVAALTVLERFTDVFISWLPMYGETKLAFIVFLWSSKTKGSSYIYERLMRPYIAMYEKDIDKQILEMKARALDLAIYGWQYCALNGQSMFFKILEYLASQSTNRNKTQKSNPPSAPPMTPKSPMKRAASSSPKSPMNRQPEKEKTLPELNHRRLSVKLMVAKAQAADVVEEQLQEETLSPEVESTVELDQDEVPQASTPKSAFESIQTTTPKSGAAGESIQTTTPKSSTSESIRAAARNRLRRAQPISTSPISAK